MYPKSPSISSLDKEMRFDYSNYSNEFNQQRNSRTLSLRRNTNLLTIANFKKTEFSREYSHRLSNGSISINKGLLNSLIPKTQFHIDLDEFLDVFNSGNEEKIVQFSDKLAEIIKKDDKDFLNSFKEISQSKEAGESYGMAISMAESNNLLYSLFNLLIYSFPLFSHEAKEEIVNSGVALKVDEILADLYDQYIREGVSASNFELLIIACHLISALSKNSTYARDSFICYSVNERILNMLTSIVTLIESNQSPNDEIQIDEQLNLIINALSDAIQTIYTTKLHCVDNLNELITDQFIDQMIQLVILLDSLKLNTIKSIMACLVSILSNYQAVVKNYFNNQLEDICISLLNEPELTDVSLLLLGNMCAIAEPNQLLHTIKTEVDESSLFQILVDLIPTEYAADAFWIMSSLFEKLYTELMSFITAEFIEYIISIGESSNFHVRKESTFFIATVITKVPTVYIPQFAESEPLMNTLIEMIGCDESKVIMRCFFAISCIIKAILQTEGAEAVANVFSESELTSQIETLKEEHEDIIKRISSFRDSTFEAIINNEDFLASLDQS